MVREQDGRKHDVADNAASILCNQRDDRPRFFAQLGDQIGLSRSVKGQPIYRLYSKPVFLYFGSDLHGNSQGAAIAFRLCASESKPPAALE
jgi:hypothetical protein